MKHTPGPWTIEKHRAPNGGNYYRVLAQDERIVAQVIGNGAIEYHNDARLIAAAPELLEALQAVRLGFVDGSIKWAKPRQADTDPYHPANVLMTAAIAKATQDPQG